MPPFGDFRGNYRRCTKPGWLFSWIGFLSTSSAREGRTPLCVEAGSRQVIEHRPVAANDIVAAAPDGTAMVVQTINTVAQPAHHNRTSRFAAS